MIEAGSMEAQRRVQHPYFGLLTIEDFGIFAAAHTRHHIEFLRANAMLDAE